MRNLGDLQHRSHFDPLESLSVLVAEDEPTQRLLLARSLERAGYRVDSVSDGAAALARLQAGDYSMLVTDWDMPGLDGAALCREVRCGSLEHYVYIVILTSHDLAADLVNGLDAGADDYVRKSASADELLARLAAGARIVRLERSLRAARARIQLLSVRDPLLPLFNRRFLTEQLALEVGRARRYTRPLSIVLADLDHFKRINDQYGHLIGDDVLSAFVALVSAQLRVSDWAARFGGEEFVFVLPETELEAGRIVAEKLRTTCAAAPLVTNAGAIPVTASFGVASFAAEDAAANTPELLLRRADEAMYRSKEAGRNRVTVAPPGKPTAALEQ